MSDTILQFLAAWLVLSVLVSLVLARVIALGSDNDELFLTHDMRADVEPWPVGEERLLENGVHPGAVL